MKLELCRLCTSMPNPICVFGVFRTIIFWMSVFKVFRWNGLKILIPKHMWKSQIGPLEQTGIFFWSTLYYYLIWPNLMQLSITWHSFTQFNLFHCFQVWASTDENQAKALQLVLIWQIREEAPERGEHSKSPALHFGTDSFKRQVPTDCWTTKT